MAVWNSVNISYVLSKNRIDSEFYKKEDVELEQFLNKVCGETKLKSIAEEIKERFNRSECEDFQYNDIGNVNARFGNIKTNILTSNKAPGRAAYVNKKDDILISTVRPNRNANAIVNSSDYLQVGSNGFCNLRTKSINPNYIYAYSKTFYFIQTLVRATTSSMYPSVSNTNILNVPFFIPEIKEINKISEWVETARELLLESQELYQKATDLLETELGLNKITFEKAKSYTVSFSDLVINRRIDSDFYNPDYEMLKSHLKTLNGEKLRNISFLRSGFAFSSDKYKSEGSQIVRIQNISGNLLNLKRNPVFYSDSDLVSLSNFKIRKGDTLMAMTGNTIGNCSLNTSDSDLYLNQRVLAITPDENYVTPEYLNLILRNTVFKTFIDRELVGGAQPNISLEFIGNQIVPIVNEDSMEIITNNLKKHYSNSEKSKELLAKAKKRVEELIEEAAKK